MAQKPALSLNLNRKKNNNKEERKPRISQVKLKSAIRQRARRGSRSPFVPHCWRAFAPSSPRLVFLRGGVKTRGGGGDAVSWRRESDKRIPAETHTGAEETLGK